MPLIATLLVAPEPTDLALHSQPRLAGGLGVHRHIRPGWESQNTSLSMPNFFCAAASSACTDAWGHCQTGYIDYDKLEEKALDFRPRMIICGGSAYPREWDYARLSAIAGKIGALLMCDMAHYRRAPQLPATSLP